MVQYVPLEVRPFSNPEAVRRIEYGREALINAYVEAKYTAFISEHEQRAIENYITIWSFLDDCKEQPE